MKTTSNNQIEKLNYEIKKTKQLLKLFLYGEEYFEHKIKKLKKETNMVLDKLNKEELENRLNFLSSKVDALKKRPSITVYNDGTAEDAKRITLESIQMFVSSSFNIDLQPEFGLIKNVDKLDRVSVFVVEDDRLSNLIMERSDSDFDYKIQFECEESWVQDLMKVKLKNVVKPNINNSVQNDQQLRSSRSFHPTFNPSLIKTSPSQSSMIQTHNTHHIIQQPKKVRVNPMRPFIDPQATITRLDLLLSFRQMIREHYPLPLDASLMRKATKSLYKPVNENSPLIAIDCEMCKTETGLLDVTKIALVDEKLNVLMNEYVKPKDKITDYLIQYSGIEESHLKAVTTTLEDIHQKLEELLPADAILVGHSLNCDLHSLQLTHPYIIDTSCIYNFGSTFQSKPSLRQLARHFLRIEIQNCVSGHCPIEDAKATMQLVQLKLSKNIAFGDNRLSKQLEYTCKSELALAQFLKFKEQQDVQVVYDYLELEVFKRFISVTSKHMNRIIDKIAWATTQSNSIVIVILKGTCLIKIV